MAALHKFKMFATQCGVAQSPTRSPRTSPLVHMGRPQKTTLRMLLGRCRRGSDERQFLPGPMPVVVPCIDKKDSSGRHKLKDLFGSHSNMEDADEVLPLAIGIVAGAGVGAVCGSITPRRGFMGLRYRVLLKRGWRPVLETIPE